MLKIKNLILMLILSTNILLFAQLTTADELVPCVDGEYVMDEPIKDTSIIFIDKELDSNITYCIHYDVNKLMWTAEEVSDNEIIITPQGKQYSKEFIKQFWALINEFVQDKLSDKVWKADLYSFIMWMANNKADY